MSQEDLLKKKFDELKKKKKCGFISFITAGDPDFNTSYKILEKLPESGVDIIELGMPFSDPMADGPVIQKANDRAIKNKMNLKKTFGLIKKFRKKNKITPLVLMGYYNPIHKFGIKNFINQINKNKVNGVIVVDLPPEEDNELCLPIMKNKIHFIKLATPTTDKNRFKKIIKNSSGFIYYVSITGITGANYKSNMNLEGEIKNLKKLTKLPIAVGFGIKNKKDVKKLSRNADAVVVGSSIIKKIEEALKKKYNKIKLTNYVLSYIRNLSSSL
ncbi:MAG: tryptophan synthase subunit alpha [Alphaproteobacteria bacterium]|nr:tryptophan synthase subunit alpha [Alphaproteobacteria bacterium]|tara:strand:- start:1651 stop:2466 length:816 start_codon:yes stop_codon:yes gene_type:complete